MKKFNIEIELTDDEVTFIKGIRQYLMNIISDIEWKEFVDDGIVSQDIIDIISIRIKYNYELTDRELAIYKEKSFIIENNIKKLNV